MSDVEPGRLPQPFPLQQQLICDVGHPVEHPLQRFRTEGGHEDAVRLAPVRLLSACREQAVPGEVFRVPQGLVHRLVEPFLVAQFIGQPLGGHQDGPPIPAGQVHREDLAVPSGQPHETLGQAVRVDLVEVPDQRFRVRTGDR